MTNIIAFTGAAGSGKDTCCDAILYEGSSNYKLGFADPIYEACDSITDYSFRDFSRQQKEEVHPDFGVSPRQMLQQVGELGRSFRPDFWILSAERTFRNFVEFEAGTVVFCDLRYDNEAEWVHSLGGKIVRVVRPELESVRPHSSENGIDERFIDYTIINQGSLKDLVQYAKEYYFKCLK